MTLHYFTTHNETISPLHFLRNITPCEIC